MNKLCSLVICVMALLFAACEPNAPATSSKVETGAASDITTGAVVLHGVVNVDISQYEDVEFGVMVSEDKADLNARDGEMYRAKVLIGKDFELTLEGLSPDTRYYLKICNKNIPILFEAKPRQNRIICNQYFSPCKSLDLRGELLYSLYLFVVGI